MGTIRKNHRLKSFYVILIKRKRYTTFVMYLLRIVMSVSLIEYFHYSNISISSILISLLVGCFKGEPNGD